MTNSCASATSSWSTRSRPSACVDRRPRPCSARCTASPTPRTGGRQTGLWARAKQLADRRSATQRGKEAAQQSLNGEDASWQADTLGAFAKAAAGEPEEQRKAAELEPFTRQITDALAVFEAAYQETQPQDSGE